MQRGEARRQARLRGHALTRFKTYPSDLAKRTAYCLQCEETLITYDDGRAFGRVLTTYCRGPRRSE